MRKHVGAKLNLNENHWTIWSSYLHEQCSETMNDDDDDNTAKLESIQAAIWGEVKISLK